MDLILSRLWDIVKSVVDVQSGTDSLGASNVHVRLFF